MTKRKPTPYCEHGSQTLVDPPSQSSCDCHDRRAPCPSDAASTPATQVALQDYKIQLLLLDRQNKRRLVAARQWQQSQAVPGPEQNPIAQPQQSTPALTDHALRDYQTQLKLLEEQNKRFTKARTAQAALEASERSIRGVKQNLGSS